MSDERIGKLLARLLSYRSLFIVVATIATCAGLSFGAQKRLQLRIGKQSDGSFLVSTEQRVEANSIPFAGRPIDMALHPSGEFVAILNQKSVLILSKEGVVESEYHLRFGSGFRGITWSADGSRLFVSSATGNVVQFLLKGKTLTRVSVISLKPTGAKGNPRPGGIAVTKDGTRLFVAVTDRNAVAEIDLTKDAWVKEYPVQNMPFEVKLSRDETSLVVSNWGGRPAEDEDDQAKSGAATIVVDPRGAASSGTVSIIKRATGETQTIKVGLHPTAIVVQGDRAFITNSASDSLSEIDLPSRRLVRTLPIQWGRNRLFGSMPCAIAIQNRTAYVCNGGDNAICEVDLNSGKTTGFRPAGFYPVAIALSPNGSKAFVLNTKGNGSVRRTLLGKPGNSHDFQGTLTILDLTANLAKTTKAVAGNNGWNRDRSDLKPDLDVYQGKIKHVLYIIKENRTYDDLLGDMPQGNGDPKLCNFGEKTTPNHHELARKFCLFDNAYAVGTNSADGHQWCTQALANDYLEHFYAGYRTYPFGGECAMSISSAGCLWDAALKKRRTIRNYGEFCDSKLAVCSPKGKSWLEVWKDRTSGKRKIDLKSGTRIASLRPYLNRNVLQWPLIQSDQSRADIFIGEYQKFSRADTVPNLMFLTLPCDHTEGRNPYFPKPQSMIADNDFALGRVVEAVSRSPQWEETCIMVIEDDTQFGLDHVDGHRTAFYAISPYTRRGFVDHELCNTVSMIRSIELMLGLAPMNRFDALTPPLRDCFTDTPNFAPYVCLKNRIPLDDMNETFATLRGEERYWTAQSLALDWSDPDRADPEVLNRVLWHTARGTNAPYPNDEPLPSQ